MAEGKPMTKPGDQDDRNPVNNVIFWGNEVKFFERDIFREVTIDVIFAKYSARYFREITRYFLFTNNEIFFAK